MTRRSCSSRSLPRVPATASLLATAVALVLSALPLDISAEGPSLQLNTALAKGGDGGGGHGGKGAGGGFDYRASCWD